MTDKKLRDKQKTNCKMAEVLINYYKYRHIKISNKRQVMEEKRNIFFFFFLAMAIACGSSWARKKAQAPAVTMLSC